MTAYSFKPRFVGPVKAGLDPASKGGGAVYVGSRLFNPKRQTIRAVGLKRHARPGEELQLYCGMRTKKCFLIGRARCLDVQPIRIVVGANVVDIAGVRVPRRGLDDFSRRDGFDDWGEMARFWRENHRDDMNDFLGVLIKWVPL